MEKKEWMPVNGYEGYYEISKAGKVRGVKRLVVIPTGLRTIYSRELATRINNDGYVEVRLSKEGNTKTNFVHILLANAFIPNPKIKAEVNHINGIKTDNRIENLEWVTRSENMRHAYKHGLCKNATAKVIDICTGKEYASIKEAAENLGIKYSTCRNYLSGNIKSNKTCLQYVAA